jgi:hypothetical protein
VDTIVVGERLCPFVMPLKSSNTLRYVASDATSIDQAVLDVANEANLLMPEHAATLLSSTNQPRRRIVDENVKLDIWALNDDSDDEDEADPNDSSNTIDAADLDGVTNDELQYSKLNLHTEEVEKVMSEMNIVDTNRAVSDVLSEAHNLMKQQQDFRDRRMMKLRELVAEAEKPDSTLQIATSIDEVPLGMLKKHYEQVFDELEEPVRQVARPLPSRPHGATLIMFNAEFVQDFRDFEDLCEAVYRKVFYDMDYYDLLHIFLFHPKHVHIVYANDKKLNPVDYVMRSPFPTLLLIREVDMKAAYLSNIVPHIRQLSDRNKSNFLNQGLKACTKRLEACYVPQEPSKQ